MANVNNTNLKRAPHSPEPGDQPSKYIKIDHDSRGEKRNRVNGIDKPAKYRRIVDNQGIKRMHGDSSGDDGDDEYVRNSEKYRRLNDRQGFNGKVRGIVVGESIESKMIVTEMTMIQVMKEFQLEESVLTLVQNQMET